MAYSITRVTLSSFTAVPWLGVITRVADSIVFLPTENLQVSFGYLPPRPPRRSSGQQLGLRTWRKLLVDPRYGDHPPICGGSIPAM